MKMVGLGRYVADGTLFGIFNWFCILLLFWQQKRAFSAEGMVNILDRTFHMRPFSLGCVG
jgi:hypothetical protein